MAFKEVVPMTEKEYIEWYREKYNTDPPFRILTKYFSQKPEKASEDDWEEWLT